MLLNRAGMHIIWRNFFLLFFIAHRAPSSKVYILRKYLWMSAKTWRRRAERSKSCSGRHRVLRHFRFCPCHRRNIYCPTSHTNIAGRARERGRYSIWERRASQVLRLLIRFCYQDILFSITNTFEGTIFVNANDTASESLSDYVTQLFPTLSPSQVASVVEQYINIGLDGTYNQAIGVMGECEPTRCDQCTRKSWFCHSYLHLPNAQGSSCVSWAITQGLLMSLFCIIWLKCQ